jgi:hypothetical protein
MEPFTMLAIIAGLHLARKLSGHASPSAAAKCRWCGNSISGDSNITTCCKSQLCQSCTPQWQQAGGKHCVLCGTGG